MLVALEGIDGCGKSTLAKMLFDYLNTKHYNVQIIKFPTQDNLFGRMIHTILNGNRYELHPFALQMIFALDKYCNLEKLINHKDKVIILDRYILSSIAYGLYDLSKIKSIDSRDIKALEQLTAYLPQPDITFYIDANVKMCIERKYKQLETLQQYKQMYEHREILEIVQRWYRYCVNEYMVKMSNGLTPYKYVWINGNDKLDNILNDIIKSLEQYHILRTKTN